MSWPWVAMIAAAAYFVGRTKGFFSGAGFAERYLLNFFKSRHILDDEQIKHYLYHKWEGSHVDRVER